jgi:hypothetical protein
MHLKLVGRELMFQDNHAIGAITRKYYFTTIEKGLAHGGAVIVGRERNRLL